MRSVSFAILLLVAGSTALPQDVVKVVEANEIPAEKNDVAQPRFVEDLVASAIEAITAQMQELGLDPLVVDSVNFGYALPVPSLFNMNIGAEELRLAGISNIIINNINYSIFTLRVDFDISLPEIFFSVGNVDGRINFLGNTLTGGFSGSVKITNPGIRGRTRINIGIISGISISELDLNLYLDGVESALSRVTFMNRDYSRIVNYMLSDGIPAALNEYSDDINEMLEIIVWALIDDLL